MSAIKKRMTDVIRQQPEDSSYDEIFREWLYAEWWIEDWKILGKAVR